MASRNRNRRSATQPVTPVTTQDVRPEVLADIEDVEAKVAASLADASPEPERDAQPAKPAKLTPAKSCGQFFELNGIGEAGCKRLPRHKGEHRVTLHRPQPAKPAKVATKAKAKTAAKRRPMSAAKRREFAADLAAKVDAGDMTPSEALAAMAKVS